MSLSACSYEKRQPEASVVFDSLSTGRLLVSGMMINGRKYGVWNTYYESGQIKSISTYVNDTLNGPWVFYKDEGNISSKGQTTRKMANGCFIFGILVTLQRSDIFLTEKKWGFGKNTTVVVD